MMKPTNPEAPATIRAFLALPVPAEAITYATLLQGVFRDQGVTGSRVRPEAMHITVEFLGDQTEEKLRRLTVLLRERLTGTVVPVVQCLGPDTFGRPPSVLFVAWTDPDFRFRRMAEMVRQTSRDAELDSPAGEGKRKPVPHMTFLRLKDPQAKKNLRKLRCNTSEGADWKPFLPPIPKSLAEVTLDKMELIASTLTSDGPLYQTLETFDLRGGAQD
ncbi:MAG: RNA 2',3'-cyclic phosphodiesterase [Verrucomicrobiota bacterium]